MGPDMASLKLANICLKLLERIARFELVFIGVENRGTTLIPYPQIFVHAPGIEPGPVCSRRRSTNKLMYVHTSILESHQILSTRKYSTIKLYTHMFKLQPAGFEPARSS